MIFEKFKQLESARKQKGAGLGLYHCQVISALHGGGIRAESEPGKGADFILSLPRVKAAVPVEENGEGLEGGLRGAESSRGRSADISEMDDAAGKSGERRGDDGTKDPGG